MYKVHALTHVSRLGEWHTVKRAGEWHSVLHSVPPKIKMSVCAPLGTHAVVQLHGARRPNAKVACVPK